VLDRPGSGLPGELRQGVLIRRDRAEPQPGARTAGQGVADQLLRRIDLCRVAVEDEDDADGEPVFGLKVAGVVEAEPLGFLFEERLRELAEEAGAVAGVAADAAAVFECL
jgi:hypothetical protein